MGTGETIRIENLRGNRSRPGLKRQHLTGVRAAPMFSDAHVTGAHLASSSITFRPGRLRGGDFRFDIGSAGSTLLVLQTVLPALLATPEPSTVTVADGTHNGLSPPWPFFEACVVPLLRLMDVSVTATWDRAGFFPAAGGQITLTVHPCPSPRTLVLHDRNPAPVFRATALLSRLPRRTGDDQLRWLGRRLQLERAEVHEASSPGPGNAVFLHVAGGLVDLVLSGFGDRRRRGRAVAEQALRALEDWQPSGVPVDEHLADQLLIPLVLAGACDGSVTDHGSGPARPRRAYAAGVRESYTQRHDRGTAPATSAKRSTPYTRRQIAGIHRLAPSSTQGTTGSSRHAATMAARTSPSARSDSARPARQRTSELGCRWTAGSVSSQSPASTVKPSASRSSTGAVSFSALQARHAIRVHRVRFMGSPEVWSAGGCLREP